MKRITTFSLCLALAGAAVSAQSTDELVNEPIFDTPGTGAAGGEKRPFNGQDLNQWDGSPDLWAVEEGAIVGRTSADKPLKQNSFLVWKGGTVGNFDLTFKYKIPSGNSGVQYRSKQLRKGSQGPVVGGYQADFEAGDRYSGILYEEGGRGILAERGQKVTVKSQEKDPADPKAKGFKLEVTGQVGVSDEIQKAIKKDDWNEYRIVAKGGHLQHYINGKLTVDVTDETAEGAKTGILALQIHAGPPMTVYFKDMVLKDLK